jgi:non-homologous end joining protein Ku
VLDITWIDVIDLVEVDPVFFESSCYRLPGKGGAKPCMLFQQAM